MVVYLFVAVMLLIFIVASHENAPKSSRRKLAMNNCTQTISDVDIVGNNNKIYGDNLTVRGNNNTLIGYDNVILAGNNNKTKLPEAKVNDDFEADIDDNWDGVEPVELPINDKDYV